MYLEIVKNHQDHRRPINIECQISQIAHKISLVEIINLKSCGEPEYSPYRL